MIVVSVVFLTITGLISTTLWDRLRDLRQDNRRLRTVALLLLSVIGVVVGTWASSYYWNAYFQNIHDQEARDQMVHYLASEVLTNLNIIQDKTYTDTVDQNMSGFVFYPALENDALRTALASCLFGSDHDKRLFTCLADVNKLVVEFNRGLDITQSQLMKGDTANTRLWRTKVRDGKRV